MHKIRERILKAFFVPAAKMLSPLAGTDRRSIVLGGMHGTFFGDNAMHLYLWLLENRGDLKPVWMTRDIATCRQMRRQGRPAAFIGGPDGIIALARARAGLFSNSLSDLMLSPSMVPRGLPLVALRHGRSVKKVRFARETHKISGREARERRLEGRHIAFALSTSDFISDMQEQCLRIGREKHVVTGYPRNDVLFEQRREHKRSWNKYIGDTPCKKVLLYAPTWRHGRKPVRFFPFDDFDERQLYGWLENNGIILLLRPHRNEWLAHADLRAFLGRLADGSRRVKAASHDVFPDVNSILPFVDVLVTDYSAVYHDFLLLDRPMAFIPYDYGEFKRQNGFLYDYFANLPGPAISSFREFRDCIGRYCRGGDDFAARRASLAEKVHFYRDAGSCERVSKLIDRLLKNKEGNDAYARRKRAKRPR